MRLNTLTRRTFLGAGLALLPLVSGCGSAGSLFTPKPDPTDNNVPTAYASLAINWPQLGRSVDAPTSARSAKITIKRASASDQSDVVFVASRDDSKNGTYSASYRSDQSVYTGKRNITVEFYTLPEGNGTVVASATGLIAIEDNGQIQQSISFDRKIGSVEVEAGQIVTVGSQIYLRYSVRDGAGNLIAVSPGSAQFAVASGAGNLTAMGEVAKGLVGGVATVTATVDGVTSPAAEIAVQASVKVALIANPDDAEVVAFKQYLTARNVTYSSFNDVPDATTLSAFDVLMATGDMAQNAFIGTDDASKIKAYLYSGRGVILFGNAPLRLTGTGDTKAIASWFGGVNDIQGPGGFDGYARNTTGGQFNLPLTAQPGSKISEGGIHAYRVDRSDITNPQTEFVLSLKSYYGDFTTAFAYNTKSQDRPSGGKLYWQSHPYNTDSTYSSKIIDILLAATNWAGGR